MEHRGNKLAIVMGTEPNGDVGEASGAMGMQQAQGGPGVSGGCYDKCPPAKAKGQGQEKWARRLEQESEPRTSLSPCWGRDQEPM